MRCYDGCPDDEMQSMIDRQEALMKQIRVTEPEAHCTYFPACGTYQVHAWGRAIGAMCGDRESALSSALRRLTCAE